MKNPMQRNLVSWLFMGLPLAVTVMVGGWNVWLNQTKAVAETPVPAHDLPELITLLRHRGVDVRVVPVQENGRVGNHAFLTTTGADWHHFNSLPRNPGKIDRWQGCVYSERVIDPTDRSQRASEWGGCCLQRGEFVFFGDPTLLNQIRQALRVS
jgi:hypothetical protein